MVIAAGARFKLGTTDGSSTMLNSNCLIQGFFTAAMAARSSP